MSVFDQLPTVQFTVKGLKANVLHAMAVLTDDMNAAVKKQVEKSIQDFNWEREVHDLTVSCIRSNLEHYFKYGQGYHQIKSAIEMAFEPKETENGE